MELIFIRHGQGEHTLDIPRSLHIKNPSLTLKGIKQAKLLREKFLLTTDDVLFLSPVRRTLETAIIWTAYIDCRKIVSPLVAPRIFPSRPNAKTLPCDRMIDFETIQNDYPKLEMDLNMPLDLWSDGINTMSNSKFNKIAGEFITYLRLLKKDKIYIVSHDGTITAYRQLITGQSLSRQDFPDETGFFRIRC